LRELPRVIRSRLAILVAATGRRRMHAHRPRAISRLAVSVTAATAIVIVVALAGTAPPSVGRPPSAQASIPPDAFRPVALPESEPQPSSTPWPGLAPEPDEVIPDPAGTDHTEVDPPAAASPQPSPPDGPIHTVRTGDNLWLIAAWHKVDLEPIITWNPGVDPRRLVAGQDILVPGGAPMPANATPPAPPPPPPPAPAPAPKRAQAPAQAPAQSSDGSGSHLWPLPIRGTITTRFSGAHAGIDIAAPSGTPVRAIAGGTVVYAGWRNNGGGYVVEIRHPNGMISTYNHNREVTVSVGQVVATGELVARVGSTGNSTGPHLDLRVEMGGKLVNPLRLDW